MATVSNGAVPAGPDELLALRDRLAGSPEGGAAVFLAALLALTRDAGVGRACLAIASDTGCLLDGPMGFRGRQLSNRALQALGERVGGRPHVAASYVVGTDPDHGYAFAEPVSFTFVRTASIGGQDRKVFVASSGADNPRPMTVRANGAGIWKAVEWSSLELGVRSPAPANPPVEL